MINSKNKKQKTKKYLGGDAFEKMMVDNMMFNQEMQEDRMLNREFTQEAKALARQRQKLLNTVKLTRDYNKPLNSRQQIWSNYVMETGSSGAPDCTGLYFGEFQVITWGIFGGCGFNIWDVNNNKYWIDVDTIYNLAKEVKEGPDAANKQSILAQIPDQNRTPDCLYLLFPEGYKATAGGPLKTRTNSMSTFAGVGMGQPVSGVGMGQPVSGGRKNKTKKSRKFKKVKKSRKIKKVKKSRKSRK
jgi:hypothetical protein